MRLKQIICVFFVLVIAGMALGCQRGAVQDGVDDIVGTAENAAMRGGKPIFEKENLLVNAGFEQGTNGWTWLDWSKGWSGFSHDTKHAYEGDGSIHFSVVSDHRETTVWGAVQEPVLFDDIPECIEGYYYVEDWDNGPWKQYLQLVVIDLTHSLGPKQGQAQLRYIISGSKTPPLNISNAQYLFLEKPRADKPKIGQWTRFVANPRRDFQENWQYTPTKNAKLRVLFEARYDLHSADMPLAKAEVYFDNLYMGPKTSTRCVD